MTTFTTQDRQDAQRELKKKTPFTAEQLWPIVNEFFGKDMEIYYEFARAIERAHGIGE